MVIENILHFLVVLLYSIPGGVGDIVKAPLNTAHVQLVSFVLECSIDSGGLQQWQEDYSDNPQKIISYDAQVTDPYKDKYDIEGTAENYNLVVKSASFSIAGTHLCLDAIPVAYAKAEIIVLGSDPVCESNATAMQNILIEGEYAYYTCSISYQGSLIPKMTWTGDNGLDIDPQDESDDTVDPKLVQYSYSVPVTSENDGQSVKVVTTFDPPASPELDDATNAPDYTNTWNSSPITVHYPPKVIMFQHCTESTCSPLGDSDTNVNINPGDRIQASAAANPNVDYFTWKNDTDTILEGSDATELSFTDIGSSSIELTVRNTMRDDTQGTVIRQMQVMVVPTTTPPPTTTPLSTIPPTSPATDGSTTGLPPTVDETKGINAGLGTAAIAGISVGVIVAVIICIVIIVCVCRKTDKEKKANETMPPKKVHADQVRQPENNAPITVTNVDEKNAYDLNTYPENPYDNNVNPYSQDGRPNENLVYADLALDDTPRSRKPVQVFEPVQYAEIRRV